MVPHSDGPAPRATVEEFFARMEDDRRTTVDELFADTAIITVPGETFSGPSAATEFLAFLEPRYEWAGKEFDRWIVHGETVISIGTLYGVDNDGSEFENVRYVDIYEVNDGIITRLDIYNDLAAEGVTNI